MTSDNIKSISGQIAGVNLSSFLQMIEMEQKTCTIKIFTKKDMGQIYFLNGTLIDADTMKLNHIEALYEILAWNNIVIEVEKNEFKQQDIIKLPLMHILIESARRSDEKRGSSSLNDSEDISIESQKNIPLKILKNKDFCLEIGVQLLIDFDELAITFRSVLIGIEHGKYLLLKAPSPFGRVDHELCKVGGMTIKSLYKGTIYAFRSKLLGIISEPSKLMFIEYPQKIEHYELRSHKRFKCSIVAQTQVDDKGREGVIENISKGGCRCIIETFLTDKKSLNNLLNNTIPFKCHFPGSEGDVSFMGEIKNAKMESDELAVGVKFFHPENTDQIQETINNYIRLIEYSSERV